MLHPSYIHKSASEGRWLSEEDYEWNTIESNGELDDLLLMAEAPRRWRFHTEAYQKNAFSEWKVAVVVNGEKKNTVYKRYVYKYMDLLKQALKYDLFTVKYS